MKKIPKIHDILFYYVFQFALKVKSGKSDVSFSSFIVALTFGMLEWIFFFTILVQIGKLNEVNLFGFINESNYKVFGFVSGLPVFILNRWYFSTQRANEILDRYEKELPTNGLTTFITGIILLALALYLTFGLSSLIAPTK